MNQLSVGGETQGAKALVVDDELSNRVILRSLLKKLGYQVIEAENGEIAVEKFIRESPDVVFMDVMMPGMDGYAATGLIKEAAGDRFVPVIFLTALTDDNALVRCVEAGGDDFLTKPFSHVILRSKITALERIRSLNHQVNRLYNRMRQDEELAKVVFNTAVMAGNLCMESIPHRLQSAEIFSGDILLSAQSPNGDFYLLLGDFTGHGLSAAMGALPTAEVFRAMTSKGFSPPQILNAINRKLHTLLPTGMFLAAAFVRLSASVEFVEVCNCGLPDVLLLSVVKHDIKHRFESLNLPLGIIQDQDLEHAFETFQIDSGDRLLLSSDGVVEAHGANGEMYGWERFEAAIRDSSGSANVLDSVNASLDAFCAGESQVDDISMLDLPCESGLFGSCAKAPQTLPATEQENLRPAAVDDSVGNEWETSIVLSGPRLASVDPVPLLLNHLRELEGESVDYRPLFTVITELFVNALDHGVMKMDSGLKTDAEGFGRYFEERERRLGLLDRDKDRVRLSLHCQLRGEERLVRIRVEDSGDGFDFDSVRDGISSDPLRLYGRGIQLLNSLCVSLRYQAPGNVAEAVYRLCESTGGN